MATSFISKHEDSVHGFWIKDSLMQIICWAFYNVIDDPLIKVPDWMDGEFKEYLYNCSQGLYVGFTTLNLGKYVLSDERVRQFNDLIESAKQYFLRKGDYINTDEINAFQKIAETKREWLSPFETARAIKILDYIEDVINDRITIKVNDTIDYEF
jgi:hypothetical protein